MNIKGMNNKEKKRMSKNGEQTFKNEARTKNEKRWENKGMKTRG
jgi:hypothetical protein